MSDFTLEDRDLLLSSALSFTENLKGKRRDVAVFDYLCGACRALFLAQKLDSDCPAFLWVIGIRGGDRVAEISRMLSKD